MFHKIFKCIKIKNQFTIFYVDERQFEDDAIILRLIEGYCMSTNARFTLNSGKKSM